MRADALGADGDELGRGDGAEQEDKNSELKAQNQALLEEYEGKMSDLLQSLHQVERAFIQQREEYEEALKSALASSASGTYGGRMLVDVYVGVVSGSSPEAVKLGYEHVRRKLRGPSSAHVMALFATEDSDEEESSSDEEVGLPSREDLLAHLNVVQGCVALIARVIERTTEASK